MGVFPPEACDQLCRQKQIRITGDADHGFGVLLFFVGKGCGLCFAHACGNLFREGQIDLPVIGKRHISGCADQKRVAKFPFQGLDMPGKGRLGQMKMVSRRAEAFDFRQFDKF